MDKIDYKKKLSEFYAAKINKPVTITVPKMNYIMIDGRGDPNTSQDYIDAIQALYPVAYGIKFFCKKELGVDFGVMPLEGLWWMKDMDNFSADKKDDWLWTAMIMQPDIVNKDIFEKIIKQVTEKKNPKSINKVRFSSYDEGRSAQVMYVGPYADEGPTIQNLHSYIKEQGGTIDSNNKHHHEIYFSDPRRTAPDKLKTIIRQPY
ncbi:MAG: GyrI-like domain-containing protein [Candidatus Saccharibacteria bacterium]